MRSYFCGWYFKCQSARQTLALIPAIHQSEGRRSGSIQIISEEGAWNIQFPYERFHPPGKAFRMLAGGNYFGAEGIRLHIQTAACSAAGSVRFGAFSPIRYDIMGPFRYLPGMECRHGIWSMQHTVTGKLLINGVPYHFQDDFGYIEGDRGHSFPKAYAWTQCRLPQGSLMLSVAEIPWGGLQFTGVISVILWRGKEYRLATYLGAKPVKIAGGEVIIRQGGLALSAQLLEKHPHPLAAPVGGKMSRTVQESACCRARYTLQLGGKTLFSLESPRASFEYEYPC